jgi:type VI secretion system secreted protein VgrG
MYSGTLPPSVGRGTILPAPAAYRTAAGIPARTELLMPNYTQANRAMKVTTPLGPDTLLVVGLTGHEGLSQLFSFQLDLLAENTKDIAFDKLLGQPVSVSLAMPGGKTRTFNGICSRFSQGGRDNTFTAYRLEMVPALWLLTRRAQSRIFQQLSVPDILKKVLTGLDVSWEIQGTFQPRDYCVQYRETDFNFASRLMEEEGIYYFFKHEGGHKLVVANTPQSHPDLSQGAKLIYDELTGGKRPEDRIFSWEKVQELRPGKVTLWDHCFEKPHKHLEAEKTIQDSVAAGKVTHKQALGPNAPLEIYDFPGEYAQRFDGVSRGGGEQPAEIEKIFDDNKRTVGIRMQQETVPGLVIHGSSTCRHLVAGHKFTLERHWSADGPYVLTGVQHSATTSLDYRSDGQAEFWYQNSFTCIPFAQPYRPQRTTPKPFVQGTQTAVVVGPSGEEIFTDKYGRVKVQFHWDRQGKNNQESSCWVRVGQPWAGKRWGAFFWPRIGQEVIVDFLEGDPDQPIIVGSVYNADQMPPYLGKGPDSKHPDDNKLTGVKSNTTKGGKGFNEWRFDDTKDKEQIFIHAERDTDTRVKHDCREIILHDRHLIVGDKDKKQGDQREQVFQDKHLTIERHHTEQIKGNMQLLVGGGDGGNQDIVIKKDKKELVEGDHHHHVKQARNEKVDGTQSLTVGMNQQEKVGQNHALEAGMQIHLKAGLTLILEAGTQLTLKVGGNFIDINPAGVSIQGTMVMINSGGGPGSGSGASPTAPQDAQEAKPTKPDEADDAVTGQKSAP